MLAYMCGEWKSHAAAYGTAPKVVTYVWREKLVPEVLEDLRAALEVLGQSAEQLPLLCELLDPMAGVDPSAL
ncbi:hypothetical protein GPECTOR_2g1470 [Gonium pectorale]|uniref:Uncharacterized protein n=1 Tax=Gonium pectorale TaxID=33097 RepID=A0A150H1B8_GONPE|nr:hypothetical protein GPECTOR_2g1470 [Gonium pectorale]|eukprot:KXZ55919.1 hypothetical protein GPECTOR_2g1470 [Gonium pectorale]